jgi:hypothetical protein
VGLRRSWGSHPSFRLQDLLCAASQLTIDAASWLHSVCPIRGARFISGHDRTFDTAIQYNKYNCAPTLYISTIWTTTSALNLATSGQLILSFFAAGSHHSSSLSFSVNNLGLCCRLIFLFVAPLPVQKLFSSWVDASVNLSRSNPCAHRKSHLPSSEQR